MDELLETIAKRIADTSPHSACDWDFCVPENRAAFLDYAAIALDAIGETHVLVAIDADDRTRLAAIMDLLTVEEVAGISTTMPWFGLRLAQASMPRVDPLP